MSTPPQGGGILSAPPVNFSEIMKQMGVDYQHVPQVDDTIGMCQACHAQVWLGPSQVTKFKTETPGSLLILCFNCTAKIHAAMVNEGFDEPQVLVLDRDRPFNPRVTP